jgi:hypothetical protein
LVLANEIAEAAERRFFECLKPKMQVGRFEGRDADADSRDGWALTEVARSLASAEDASHPQKRETSVPESRE